MGLMTVVDLVDETFIVTPPAALAAVVADRRRWRVWWPDLTLTVFMDRGEKGIRWSATGALVGSVELWLEPFGDGAIVHYYLRADPTVDGAGAQARTLPDSPRGRRTADRLRRRHALRWKQTIWALKRELEGDRVPGDGAW
jgi:hypothetical protein